MKTQNSKKVKKKSKTKRKTSVNRKPIKLIDRYDVKSKKSKEGKKRKVKINGVNLYTYFSSRLYSYFRENPTLLEKYDSSGRIPLELKSTLGTRIIKAKVVGYAWRKLSDLERKNLKHICDNFDHTLDSIFDYVPDISDKRKLDKSTLEIEFEGEYPWFGIRDTHHPDWIKDRAYKEDEFGDKIFVQGTFLNRHKVEVSVFGSRWMIADSSSDGFENMSNIHLIGKEIFNNESNKDYFRSPVPYLILDKIIENPDNSLYIYFSWNLKHSNFLADNYGTEYVHGVDNDKWIPAEKVNVPIVTEKEPIEVKSVPVEKSEAVRLKELELGIEQAKAEQSRNTALLELLKQGYSKEEIFKLLKMS